MGYVGLHVQLHNQAGTALEQKRRAKDALDVEFRPDSDWDIEVDIDEHSGECSISDCGQEPSGDNGVH